MAFRASRPAGSETRLIALTQGYKAFVDEADLHLVEGYNWSVHKGKLMEDKNDDAAEEV